MSVDLSKGATVELVKTLSDDLRTKNDGTKHSGAGAAVRSLESDVEDLKSAFDNLIENDSVVEAFDSEWVQNRVMISNGVLTEVIATNFCHSEFLQIGKNATISVKDGYQIYAWDGAYNELGHLAGGITNAWATGTVNYTYRSSYPYLMICVMKSNSSAITPLEAESAVEIYHAEESNFALKTDLSALNERVNTSVSALQTASEANAENISVLSDYVETGEKEVSADPITPAWVQGNAIVNISAKTVTTNTDPKVCYEYLPISYGNTYYLKITNGFKIFTYSLNTNESSFLSVGAVTGNNWVDGESTISYTPPIQAYKYLLIKMIKSDNSNLTPQEAVSGLSVYENTESTTEYLYDDEFDETSAMPLQNKAIAKWDIEINTFKAYAERGQILYEGDTKVNSGHIVNAVAYDDGVIVACRSDGKVVRIGYDGSEETLLTINGSNMDWRLCWMDSNENVYVSPHASYGALGVANRGLYKLVKGASSFTKVISLYNTSSSVQTETENNNDTIWTMCEDCKGNLYAGVYAHTIRANPAVYKSTDGGNTWAYVFNFKTAGLTPDGMHIHTIIYSQWQDALYCIVGEINTIFKSTDGVNWTDLHVGLNAKGSAMCATPFGVLIGSDSAYNCEIDILFNDDATHKTVFSGWANTIFAIRRSDLTGFLYAFTKVDSSVNADSVFPPVTAITDSSALETWKNTSGHNVSAWTKYYNSVIDKYHEDAVRPQHCAILVSRDGGARWEVLKKWSLTVNANNGNNYIDGFWTTGFFKNGECLTGRMESNAFVNPIVISEGKHKYVSGGCDLDGEIFIRTNSSPVVTVL